MASKKSHKKNKSNENENTQPNFNNIDMSQLSSMLNNIDMSKLSSILGNNMFGSGDSQGDSQENAANILQGDKSAAIINAIKPLMSSERAQILDMILQLYNISKLI